jgi:hypothetical protein
MYKYFFLPITVSLFSCSSWAAAIITIDVPGAINTQLSGISNNGVAVGHYYDSSGVSHGFEVLANGTLVYPFDEPPIATLPGTGTLFNSINDSGVVVGNGGVPPTGFVFAGGSYSSFAAGCAAADINDQGDVVGYCNGQAFLQKSGNTPMALNPPGSAFNVAGGINDLGQIVGQEQIGGVDSGFLRNIDDTYSIVSYPGALVTGLLKINDQSVFIGFFEDSFGDSFDFYGTVGNLIPFSIPNATVNGINDENQIVGSYVDSNGVTHGFISSIAPEPSSSLFGLAGISVLAILKLRRRTVH